MSLTTSSVNKKNFEEFKDLSIYINDGDQTAYKCDLTIRIDLFRGMKYNLIYVSCSRESNNDLAVNSEVGLYRFTLNVEDVDIGCQFAGVYKDSKAYL